MREQGRLEESIQAYQKALELQPKSAEAYYNQGNAFLVQGSLEESIQTYRKAIEIQPNHSGVYNNLGIERNKVG